MQGFASLGRGRTDNDLNAFSITEIFLSHAADIVESDFGDLLRAMFLMIEAESHDLIGGAERTEGRCGLISDGLSTEDLGLGSVQLSWVNPSEANLAISSLNSRLARSTFLGSVPR